MLCVTRPDRRNEVAGEWLRKEGGTTLETLDRCQELLMGWNEGM